MMAKSSIPETSTPSKVITNFMNDPLPSHKILLRPFPDLLHILHTHNLHNQGLLGGKATLNLDELLEKALLNLLMMDGAHLKKKKKNHGINECQKMRATLACAS